MYDEFSLYRHPTVTINEPVSRGPSKLCKVFDNLSLIVSPGQKYCASFLAMYYLVAVMDATTIRK
jgi:hypothetical protein